MGLRLVENRVDHGTPPDACTMRVRGGRFLLPQGGTDYEDDFEGAAVGQDGGIVLAGHTTGNWSGESEGGVDFAAVKLDADGNVLWKWQVNSSWKYTLR